MRGTLHSTSHVRTANAIGLVHLLRERGAMSRAELVRASGLTKPTVMAIVRSLLEDGVAVESGVANGHSERGGRPGSLVAFNREAGTAVAAIYGLAFDLAHVNAAGEVLARDAALPMLIEPEAFLAQTVRETRRLTDEASSLGSLALAVPGFIDHAAGTVTYPEFRWERVPMQATLEDALGVPVGLLSLPSADVVGEVIDGAATGHDDAVVIFLAHGIGAGILSRGRLLLGAGGAVGELGHCPVAGDLPCHCGRRGCLETVAAGWTLRSEAMRMLERPDLADAEIADLAALGDPRIDAVLARGAESLGAATAWLTNLLDPSIVILADTRFVRGADTFFAGFEAAVRAHAVSGGLEIVRGTADARLRGTVQAALELLPEVLRPQRTVCA
jgi:predicted NBD/HSP70 family sugar kinase